jgi:hypothetical protein
MTEEKLADILADASLCFSFNPDRNPDRRFIQSLMAGSSRPCTNSRAGQVDVMVAGVKRISAAALAVLSVGAPSPSRR